MYHFLWKQLFFSCAIWCMLPYYICLSDLEFRKRDVTDFEFSITEYVFKVTINTELLSIHKHYV